MKSYNHLMEKFLTEENYYLAVQNATMNKYKKRRKHQKAKYLRKHPDEFKKEILTYAANFESDNHTQIEINDGITQKKRIISAPTLREQVVHHMVMNILKPIFLKSMYEHSYGSIPGRGSHAGHLKKKKKGKRRKKKKDTRGGKETIEKWIHKDKKGMKYCLKMDIHHYYNSVPRDKLKEKLKKYIHDEKFLNIMNKMVDVKGVPEGIPIGFYTSQWFANWYLTDLDHFIKEKLKAKHYIRYVDDMVIFDSNKRKLHNIQKEIQKYLNEKLGLQLKSNWAVFLFHYIDKKGQEKGRDLDFMGFRFYRNRTVLRRSIMLNATRKTKRISKKKTASIYDCRQMLSKLGWIDCTDTYNMYLKYIKPYISFQKMKIKIRLHQKNIKNYVYI